MPCSRSPGGCLVWGSAPGGAWSQGGLLLVGGAWSRGCLLLGVVAFCYGLLFWSSVMPFWFGGLLIEGTLLVWSSGGAEGHNRRPPHQKAVTVAWWRSPPQTATAVGSTHPTGMHSFLFQISIVSL